MSGGVYTVKDVCTLLKIKLKPRVSIYIYRTIFFILEGVAETASFLSFLYSFLSSLPLHLSGPSQDPSVLTPCLGLLVPLFLCYSL